MWKIYAYVVAQLCGFLAALLIQPLDKGVIFTKLDKPLYYSSDVYTVSVKYDLNLLRTQDQIVEENFGEFKAFLDKQSANDTALQPFLPHLSLLHGEIMAFEQETQALLSFIPDARVKRGLGDVIGRTIASATGLLDDEDGEKISSKLVRLSDASQQLRVEITSAKLVVKNILEETLNHTKILGLMAKELVEHSNGVLEVQKLVALDQRLQRLSFWVTKLKMQRELLRLGLENAIKGRLSPELLPSFRFLAILQEVAKAVESPLEMLESVALSSLATYYELSEIRVAMGGAEMCVTLSIPLKRASSKFQLFKLISMPVYCEELNYFVQFQIRPFILVSEDYKWYLPMTEEMLQRCRAARNVTLCPAIHALVNSNEDSCEFSIISSFPLSPCKKLILREGGNFFQKAGADWLFSVKNDTKVSVRCGAAHEFKTINGSGLLRGVSNCDLTVNNRLLLAGAEKNERKIFTAWAEFAIPGRDKGGLLTSWEKEKVEMAKKNGDIAEKIQNSMSEGKKALEMYDVLQSWDKEWMGAPAIPAHWQLHGTSSLVIVSSIIIIVLILKYREMAIRYERPHCRG